MFHVFVCNQMLMGTFIPVNTLLKVKEKLLRERELEIQSQKKQILQLHVWIRENEHRAQQVLHIQRGQFDALNPNTEVTYIQKFKFTIVTKLTKKVMFVI
ncbi:hypothetical protein ILYODFUR_019831 [Ilyodon furcidens]|uniref:Uncharacterized protein n=1 Tax=Ilyodon furcidens TaxID=33524 RepID=A0ABV0UKN4_9TELE